jgi:hypothetical protein
MHNDPIYLLEPVFHWLDGLIHEHGDYMYMVLVYVSLPLVVWILSGGLRRRFPQRHTITVIPIIVIQPTTTPPPLPPDIAQNDRPSSDDDAQSFAA